MGLMYRFEETGIPAFQPVIVDVAKEAGGPLLLGELRMFHDSFHPMLGTAFAKVTVHPTVDIRLLADQLDVGGGQIIEGFTLSEVENTGRTVAEWVQNFGGSQMIVSFADAIFRCFHARPRLM